MKIYISGKISGLNVEDARLNFSICEKNLTRFGYKVVNPMSKKYWWTRVGKLPWLVYMVFDIFLLFRCDGIFFQKNWTQSKGARIELKAAKLFGIKLINGFKCSILPKDENPFIPITLDGIRVLKHYKRQLTIIEQ